MQIGFLYDSCGDAVGGQVTKNRELVSFFESQGDELDLCDVYGLGRKKIITLWKTLKEFVARNNDIVLMLDTNNFLYIILLLFLLKHDGRIYYVVIGGDIHTYIKKNPLVKFCCKTIYKTYVETNKHKQELESIGLSNVMVMPNCCKITDIGKSEYLLRENKPIRVCTFSRVCKEKGIDTAIDAIEEVNRKLGCDAYTLDIYGPLDSIYKESFEKKIKGKERTIQYKGNLERTKAIWTLKEYYCMLFLTSHKGEGFPGAVLDAFMAGVPVISSDFNALPEVIDNNWSGYIVHEPYLEEVIKLLLMNYKNPEMMLKMRANCLEIVKRYDSSIVLKMLRDDMVEARNEN